MKQIIATMLFNYFSVVSFCMNTNTEHGLGYFFLSEEQSQVAVRWSAIGEQKVHHYFIERSGDGMIFSELGKVEALNDKMESEYEFFDTLPFAGLSYYRLKAVDIDGNEQCFDIEAIRMDHVTIDVAMYPNPGCEKICVRSNFEFKEGDRLTISGTSGRSIIDQKIKGENNVVDVQGLKQGVYYVRFSTSRGSFLERLIIN